MDLKNLRAAKAKLQKEETKLRNEAGRRSVLIGKINREIFKILVTDQYGTTLKYKSQNYEITYPHHLKPIRADGTKGWPKRACFLLEYLKGTSGSPLNQTEPKRKK
jgi:hypothetical protein